GAERERGRRVRLERELPTRPEGLRRAVAARRPAGERADLELLPLEGLLRPDPAGYREARGAAGRPPGRQRGRRADAAEHQAARERRAARGRRRLDLPRQPDAGGRPAGADSPAPEDPPRPGRDAFAPARRAQAAAVPAPVPDDPRAELDARRR